MIPLSVPNLKGSEWKYIKRCLDSNWVSSSGPLVECFEDAICKYAKAKYAVACMNGTSALFIALKLCGVKPEEEIIVPTLTFIAPVNVVKYLGAEPIFMDCDDFMNLNPEKLKDFCDKECGMTNKGLRNKKTGRIIKAIIPVHVFGNPCNMTKIMRVAKRYNLKVVEDASESLGSYYVTGVHKARFTGTIGDLGVYSFNGNKIITTGSGGMIVTNHKNLADKARYLVNQAKDDSVRNIHNEIGYNFRITSLQSALGLAQLRQIDGFIDRKKKNYELYKRELKDIPGLRLLEVPDGTSPNYWLYSLIIDSKKFGADKWQLMDHLARKNIQTRPIWYLNHLQKPYRKNQSYRIDRAFSFWKTVLSIPSSSGLKEEELRRVTKEIARLKNGTA